MSRMDKRTDGCAVGTQGVRGGKDRARRRTVLPGFLERWAGRRFWAGVAVACLLGATGAAGREITAAEASLAVSRWAGGREAPLGARGIAGNGVSRVETARDGEGRALYHAVHLEGGAVVVASAESGLVPIVAFSDGAADGGEGNPLWDILAKDMGNRLSGVDGAREAAGAARKGAGAADGAIGRNEATWAELLSDRQARAGRVTALVDTRVAPLLKTSWNQEMSNGQYVYNYFTPNHYPCGCVATAMAQVMRHHQHPKAAVASFSKVCQVDGQETAMWTLGGAFDWANMPEVPGLAILSDVQCQAIGKLCHDVGVSVHMSYSLPGSQATSGRAWLALKDAWGYANGFLYQPRRHNEPSDSELQNALFANFDAGYPVILEIHEHEVVGDGYGYSGTVAYTHINLGWGGMGDGYWYNLPTINVPENNYASSSLEGIIYNIFPDRTGVLLTGRVLDAAGNPVPGATVTGQKGSVRATDTTDARGIYALLVPGAGTYAVSAASGGLASGTASVSVADCVSMDYVLDGNGLPIIVHSDCVIGNSWGNDLVLGAAGKQTVKFDATGGTCDTGSKAYEIGGKYEWLPTPTLAGDRFLGWYTEKTGGERVTETSPVTADAYRTLYAHWAESGAANLLFHVPAGWPSALFTAASGEGAAAVSAFQVGEDIYVRYAYWNSGDEATGAFANHATVKNAAGATVAQWDDSANELGGYAQSQRMHYIGKTLAAGRYTVTVELDSGNAVAESDEGDNGLETEFTVGTVPKQEPDLEFCVPGGWPSAVFAAASGTGTAAASEFRTEDAIYVRYAYRNGGDAAAGAFTVSGTVWNAGGTAVYRWEDTPAGLGTGVQTTGTKLIDKALLAGKYTVTVELDAGKAVAESDESDNRKETSFTVGEPQPIAEADLEFYVPGGWPFAVFAAASGTGTAEASEFRPGDAIYVRYAYRNGGDAAAGAFTVSGTVEDSGGTVVYQWEGTPGGMGAGVDTTETRYIDKALPAGRYTVTLELDAGKVVAESDENNNRRQATFTVASAPPSQQPNLEFDQPGGWPAPVFATTSSTGTAATATFNTGTRIHLRAAYKNGGEVAAGAFSVLWTVKDNASGETVYRWENVQEGLETDVCVQASLPLDKTLPEGTYTLAVELDSGKVVDEGDETDNTGTATFSVVEPRMPNLSFRRPDGWPAAVYLTTEKGGTAATTRFPMGSTVYLYVAYENSGNAAAGKHTAMVSVRDSNGDEVKGWGWTCPGLAAGEGKTVEDNSLLLDWDDDYDYSLLGTYTLTVTLDTGKDVGEKYEGDNTLRLAFTVEQASQTVTFNANGGTCGTASRDYPIGGKYGELPLAEKRGCRFDGWYTQTEGGLQVTEGWRVTAQWERTFYARWTPYVDLSFRGPEGWPSPAFFSREAGSLAAATEFTVGDTLHFHLAYVNSGAADAGTHSFRLRLLDASGAEVGKSEWESTGIGAFTCNVLGDFSFVMSVAGVYTAEVELDTDGALEENDESDNVFWWSIRVVPVPGECRVSAFSLDAGSGACTVRFRGKAGKTYLVQRSQTLDGGWTTVQEVAAPDDGEQSVRTAIPGMWEAGFYRLAERE